MRICPIIEVSELLRIYKKSNVLIMDVRGGKDAQINYDKEHLEGAIFVDLDAQLSHIKDDFSNGGRHPLPEIAEFINTLAALGISKESHVVLYDNKNGANAAARMWWMMRSVGHEKVQVLNGGFSEAQKRQFPLSSEAKVISKASVSYKVEQWLWPLANMNEVEEVLGDKNVIIVDVREKERFDGLREPIDLVAGHIPGAVNIPYTKNLDSEGLFLSPDRLSDMYRSEFGEIQSAKIIIHCGSGVTACHTLLALAYAEMDVPKLYVGSWSEWSRNNKRINKTFNI